MKKEREERREESERFWGYISCPASELRWSSLKIHRSSIVRFSLARLARRSDLRACPSLRLGSCWASLVWGELRERSHSSRAFSASTRIYHFVNFKSFSQIGSARPASYSAEQQECLLDDVWRADEPSKLEFLRSEVRFRCSRELPPSWMDNNWSTRATGCDEHWVWWFANAMYSRMSRSEQVTNDGSARIMA